MLFVANVIVQPLHILFTMTKNILNSFVCASLFLTMVSFSEETIRPDDDSQREIAIQAVLSDPVVAAIMMYEKETDEFWEQKNLSPVIWMQEWRDRFQDVIAENPQSLYIGIAKAKLLSLYNGLGEYGKSQALLEELISEASSPEEKIRWYGQLGTVSRMRYQGNQNQDDRQKSQEAYEKAHSLFLLLPLEKQQSGDLGGRQIVSLCMSAALAKGANDHERAVALFRSAREMFQSSTKCAQYAVSVKYELEYITEQEMLQWAHLKEDDEATKCLEILSNLPTYRWAPSYYALNYAILRYENDSKGFQKFVSRWLDTRSFDDRTPILMANLGFSYFDDDVYEKALPIYETLRDKHRDDFRRLEANAFQRERGGCYDRILFDLAIIYSRRNDFGKAESAKTELINLFPQSNNAKTLSGINFSFSEKPWSPPERARFTPLRIAFIIAGIVMIVLGLYFILAKEEKAI